MWMRIAVTAVVTLAPLASAVAAEPDWAEAMQKVHSREGWQRGSVSQIGDSITYTKAFLAPLAWESPEDFPAVAKRVDRRLLNERKGPQHGNYSGWTVAQGRAALPKVLEQERPEIAIVMFGVNDLRKGVSLESFQRDLAFVVDACCQAGCVPILSTISPVVNKEEETAAFNRAIRKIAQEKRVPLVDFHAAILARRPNGSWNGTLLGKNDVHPTGGKNLDFTEENLRACGYALRNFVTLQTMERVIKQAF